MRVRRLAFFALLLGAVGFAAGAAACGEALFIEPGGPEPPEGGEDADAAETSVTPPDATAGDGGPRCNPAAPFGKPVPVGGLAANGVSGFRLTADEAYAYYADTNGGFFMARRMSPTNFDAPVPLVVAGILDAGALAATASAPNVSADRRILYFERDFRIWRALGDGGGSYDELQDIGIGGQPFFDEARETLFIATVGREIRKGGGLAFDPVPIGTDGGQAIWPVPTPDGKGLFVSAKESSGPEDIFVAPNALAGDPTVELVAGVNTDSIDAPMWVSRDGCLLYIASNVGGSFYFNIYLATRGQ